MKTNELVELPETVEIRGVGIPQMTAKLIERTKKKALYVRWDGAWEVFRIQITDAGELFGKMYPKREVYPCNEDFGKTAWCYLDENLARQRYSKI